MEEFTDGVRALSWGSLLRHWSRSALDMASNDDTNLDSRNPFYTFGRRQSSPLSANGRVLASLRLRPEHYE
jgi:hypothetical protein